LPTNLQIFLAFAAGFCFLRVFTLTRYVSQTWEGPRLIFWSGTVSALLLLIARVLALAFSHTAIGRAAGGFSKALAPWDFSGTIGVAVLLGLTAPLLLNFLLPGTLSGHIAARSVGTRLHHLLYDVVGTGKAVCVSLTDRKVYVGFAIDAPQLSPQEKFFGLLPLKSGYRDKDTLGIRWSVDYTPLLRELRDEDRRSGYSPGDFVIIIPFTAVASARVFDPKISTARLFSAAEPDIAAGLDQLDRGQSSDLDIAAIKAKARKRIG
jgi:hypothetical protein